MEQGNGNERVRALPPTMTMADPNTRGNLTFAPIPGRRVARHQCCCLGDAPGTGRKAAKPWSVYHAMRMRNG